MWGEIAYYVPPSEKVGGHVPRVPHQIAPMCNTRSIKLVLLFTTGKSSVARLLHCL